MNNTSFGCSFVQSQVWEGKATEEKSKDSKENVNVAEVTCLEVEKERADAVAVAVVPENKAATDGCQVGGLKRDTQQKWYISKSMGRARGTTLMGLLS